MFYDNGWYTNASTSTSWTFIPTAPTPTSFLRTAQQWCWDHHLAWFGNCISTLRYWLWKVSR